MYLILTLQVPLTLPSVFSKTDSVFFKEDTQKCVLTNTCSRACISQYTPMGVYWLVQALGHVLCNTHSWASAQRMNRALGLGSVSHSQTSPYKAQVSMNPRPNIISYQVCIEDGGRKRGELAGGSGTTKYYQFWKFGDGRMRHLTLGTT